MQAWSSGTGAIQAALIVLRLTPLVRGNKLYKAWYPYLVVGGQQLVHRDRQLKLVCSCRAPEALTEIGACSQQSDVWALGAILLQMFSGYLPYTSPTDRLSHMCASACVTLRSIYAITCMALGWDPITFIKLVLLHSEF